MAHQDVDEEYGDEFDGADDIDDREGPDPSEQDDEGDDSGATRTCPACGREMHEHADRCPRCGQYSQPSSAPLRSSSRVLWIIAVILVILGMLWWGITFSIG